MIRSAVFAGILAAAASPALAQHWGVEVGVGGPVYGEPLYGPPVYGGPVYAAPPPVYYQQALPLAPDAVFDMLEEAGFRDFGAMKPEGDIFKLSAVDPRGDLVALVVNAYTGAIEDQELIERHRLPPLRAYAPPPRSRAFPPPLPPEESDAGPRPYTPPSDEEGDPLVVR